MHAVVRRYEGIAPGSMDEVVRRGSEELIPLIRETPGFVAHYVVGGDDGMLITLSVFEDRGGVEESSRKVLEHIRGNLTPLMPQPQTTMGEVLLQTTGAAAVR